MLESHLPATVKKTKTKLNYKPIAKKQMGNIMFSPIIIVIKFSIICCSVYSPYNTLKTQQPKLEEKIYIYQMSTYTTVYGFSFFNQY